MFGRDVVCYYGYTQDVEDSPEEDWESYVCGQNHTAPGCIGATCGGETAQCFKVRYGNDFDS